MTDHTAYIEVTTIPEDMTDFTTLPEHINDMDVVARHEAKTDVHVSRDFYRFQQRFKVPLNEAEYLMHFYEAPNDRCDSFPLSEEGYRTLVLSE